MSIDRWKAAGLTVMAGTALVTIAALCCVAVAVLALAGYQP